MSNLRPVADVREPLTTTIPVVTTLLATLTVALVAIPLTTQLHRRFWRWSTGDFAITVGWATTACLIGTTLAIVAAHATVADDQTTEWDKRYQLIVATFTYGLAGLAMTFGAVAFERLSWAMVAGAATAMIVLLYGFRSLALWARVLAAIQILGLVVAVLYALTHLP